MTACPKCGRPLGVRAGGGQLVWLATCKHCSLTVRANTLAGLTNGGADALPPGDDTRNREGV